MITFALGHDVLAQARIDGAVGGIGTQHTLIADAHGSTRLLTNSDATIATSGGLQQVFHYTAYGEFAPTTSGFSESDAVTSLLYSGEYFDTDIQQQYLRRRFYDATVGRFNRADDFAGNLWQPRSLNKYAYTSGDPIRYADPTGMFEGLIGLIAAQGISTFLQQKDNSKNVTAFVYAQRALSVYEWTSGAIEAVTWYASLDELNVQEFVREFLDINKDWKDELLRKLQQNGWDEVKDSLTGAAGNALGRRYVSLDLKVNERDEDARHGRRKGVRLTSNNRVALALRTTWQAGKAAASTILQSNRVSEVLGEIGTSLVMQTLGFEDRGLAWDGQASRHGPDFFSYSEEIDIWGVFEAKGGSGKLDLNTQFGAQMDWRWIDHWYEEIGRHNDDVEDAYQSNKSLLAMVVSLDFR